MLLDDLSLILQDEVERTSSAKFRIVGSTILAFAVPLSSAVVMIGDGRTTNLGGDVWVSDSQVSVYDLFGTMLVGMSGDIDACAGALAKLCAEDTPVGLHTFSGGDFEKVMYSCHGELAPDFPEKSNLVFGSFDFGTPVVLGMEEGGVQPPGRSYVMAGFGSVAAAPYVTRFDPARDDVFRALDLGFQGMIAASTPNQTSRTGGCILGKVLTLDGRIRNFRTSSQELSRGYMSLISDFDRRKAVLGMLELVEGGGLGSEKTFMKLVEEREASLRKVDVKPEARLARLTKLLEDSNAAEGKVWVKTDAALLRKLLVVAADPVKSDPSKSSMEGGGLGAGTKSVDPLDLSLAERRVRYETKLLAGGGLQLDPSIASERREMAEAKAKAKFDPLDPSITAERRAPYEPHGELMICSDKVDPSEAAERRARYEACRKQMRLELTGGGDLKLDPSTAAERMRAVERRALYEAYGKPRDWQPDSSIAAERMAWFEESLEKARLGRGLTI